MMGMQEEERRKGYEGADVHFRVNKQCFSGPITFLCLNQTNVLWLYKPNALSLQTVAEIKDVIRNMRNQFKPFKFFPLCPAQTLQSFSLGAQQSSKSWGWSTFIFKAFPNQNALKMKLLPKSRHLQSPLIISLKVFLKTNTNIVYSYYYKNVGQGGLWKIFSSSS